jgi:outer membrane protein OmpA-like peptidoglycan-associated protein
VLSLEQQETIDFAVKNLEFKFDKDVIEDTSKPYLDKLARLMIEEKDWKLKVSGHTDSEGSEEYNIKLCRSRAYAVRNYLMKKGVSKDRILVEFFGEYVPLTENRSEEGRQRNRRVEMIFIFE